jgi:hypothetical protein
MHHGSGCLHLCAFATQAWQVEHMKAPAITRNCPGSTRSRCQKPAAAGRHQEHMSQRGGCGGEQHSCMSVQCLHHPHVVCVSSARAACACYSTVTAYIWMHACWRPPVEALLVCITCEKQTPSLRALQKVHHGKLSHNSHSQASTSPAYHNWCSACECPESRLVWGLRSPGNGLQALLQIRRLAGAWRVGTRQAQSTCGCLSAPLRSGARTLARHVTLPHLQPQTAPSARRTRRSATAGHAPAHSGAAGCTAAQRLRACEMRACKTPPRRTCAAMCRMCI